MPIKLFDLARELRKTNTEMLAVAREMGIARLSPASEIDDDTAAKFRTAISGGNAAPVAPTANGSAASAAPTSAAPVAVATGDVIEIPANVTVKELGERLGVSASDVQKVLMNMGVLAALNQRLAGDAINRISSKLGRTVHVATTSAPPTPVVTPTATAPTAQAGGPAVARKPQATNGTGTPKPKSGATQVANGSAQIDLTPRPPVVTIMGHVDHGKTTLLDTIRKATVADKEAGGITQHIGAYQVEIDGQRITFLDTPGHAAFSSMRSRGASVTDIIVIVVAADDGVMPQTEEAIKIAKQAGVPIIIAVNKIDLPDANPDRVLTELMSYELVPEVYGGDIQTVNISAKKGEGIKDLLDTILLVSEAVVEPKADPHGPVQGTIIEAKVDKGRGSVATVLVQQGTLRTGDVVVAGVTSGKVRGMADERGTKLVKAGPSSPVEIIGLSAVPEAGDKLVVAKNEKEARILVGQREEQAKAAKLGDRNLMSLESLYRQLLAGPVKELNVVIKGDVQGSVQAVRDSLLELGNSEVRVRVLHTGVGAVAESDVLLAASDKEAEEKNSLVVGFGVGISDPAKKKAEVEHVQIKTFTIIYQLIDAVKEAMIALLPPIYEEHILGKVEIRQLFRLPGGRSIAGSYVLDGVVKRNGKARLFRGKDLLTTADIDTLRRFKDDQREVAAGYECGITLSGFNDLQIGDILETFEMRQIPREL